METAGTTRAAEQGADEAGLPDDAVRALAGLGRLWGAAKYFHPYLAYRDIDWDAALVETIPRVRAATSAEAYRAAVDHLLSILGDANTRTVDGPPAGAGLAAGQAAGMRAAPGSGTELAVHVTDDGVAVVVVTDYTRFFAGDRDAAWNAIVARLAPARALVFDLRGLKSAPMAAAHVARVFAQTLPLLIDRPLLTAGTRHRMHTGHRRQRGATHGEFFSVFIAAGGEVVPPSPAAHGQKPLAFVVNAGSARVYDRLAGLQAAGLATVVLEGEAALEPGIATYALRLPFGVRVLLRREELVTPDGAIGFRPDLVVPVSSETAWDASPAVAAALRAVRGAPPARPVAGSSAAAVAALARYERDYPDMHAPSHPYRLLALFRFWNAIHYLFPYTRLLEGNWDDALVRHVPRFAREGDALDYAQAVARLVAEIQDTHGTVQSGSLLGYVGTHSPPVYVRTIEGEAVVTHLLDGTSTKGGRVSAVGALADGSAPNGEGALRPAGLGVGDVILAVDGESTAERRERLGQFIAASTPQALRWRTDQVVLAGAEGSTATLTVRGPDAGLRQVALPRTVPRPPPPPRTVPVFGVLPEGFGYVDLERLTVPQVDEALQTVWNTSGLIFDVRGYPKGTVWTIAPRLTPREVVAARFRVPVLHHPDVTRAKELHFHQTVAPSTKGAYRGRVVVLINEEAMSHAEHSCLLLEAAADVTFIGSPTGGANGDVTNVALPGGLLAGFSGLEVTHADGRQLQRLGIQPHIRVEPTIAGIRAGRDEVLEAALAFLRERMA